MTSQPDCDSLLGEVKDPFWDEPLPHSRLKHAVLDGYLEIFASKTGSISSTRGRVVFVDGYAGAGKYRSGHEGSPLIALRAAAKLAAYPNVVRQLDCYFIERDQRTFAAMECFVAGRGACLRGDLARHLDHVVDQAAGAPLFMFLDPYGFLPPLDVLIEKVLRRGSAPRLPTELLVSLMTFAANRQAGHRKSKRMTKAQEGTLGALDGFMGGGWWRDIMDDPSLAEAEKNRMLAEHWAGLLSARSGYDAWPVPVPKHWGEPGYYYLVLVTEHEQGGWYFAGQLPKALGKFYKHSVGDHLQIFDPVYNQKVGADRMRANLRHLLSAHGEFRMATHTRELYEGALGHAGLKELAQVTRDLSKGKHPELEIIDGAATISSLHNCTVRATATASLGF